MTTTIEPPAPAGPAAASDPLPPSMRTRMLRVARHRHGEAVERWDRYTVPVPSVRTTILDALTWIRTHLDPTLDVRHSCFHASCGTCGMRIDGVEGLACVTRLDTVGDGEGELAVEPLRNQPLVSDLVVDLEALAEALEPVGLPPLRRSTVVAGSRPAPGVEELMRFEDCIECGLCVSACPIAASDPAYAGPAVLAAAWRVLAEPREADPAHAAALVDGDQAAWRCHVAFECTAACPSDALPAEGIMHLRRGLLVHRLRRWLPHGGTGDGR